MVYSFKALFVALLFSALGIKLLYDGVKGNVPKVFTTLKLPASLLVISGTICQAPALFFLYAIINS